MSIETNGYVKNIAYFDDVKPFIYWSYGIGIFAERYSQVLMGVNCCLVLVYETV